MGRVQKKKQETIIQKYEKKRKETIFAVSRVTITAHDTEHNMNGRK